LGFDFAVGHLAFAAPFTAELAGDFESNTCPFNGEFPLHLGETCHYVKEEAARGCTGVDRVGEALELHALLVKLAD